MNINKCKAKKVGVQPYNVKLLLFYFKRNYQYLTFHSLLEKKNNP